ncbi:MAG TPA: glycosylasparaginase, partial [Candidatus Latescibacteria bacterium]|nr:glycosylasparaginase [Candidatus Latescibacterota bacterium]
ADPRPAEELALNFVALDKQGRYGAAGTGRGFEYAVTYPGYSQVLQSAALSDTDVGPEGGNRR